VAVVLFAACGLVWLIGQVAAILFGAHEHLPVRLVDMLGVLLRLPGTWDDPAQAWPPSSQPLLPGPVGMYAATILTFWIPALTYGLLVRLVSPRARRRRRERGAKWASWWQLRRLLVLGPRRGRIILGRRDRLRDRLLGRLYLAVEQCHSVLAFGPPGSFKTHGLVIPAILEWRGNLVTTSIKPDVLRATCAHRASLGAVWVYDPLGLAGVPGARWTPLAHCHTYTDARRIGRMLADAADIHGHKAEDANYWQLLGASSCRSCCSPPPGPDAPWRMWPAGWTSKTSTTSPKPSWRSATPRPWTPGRPAPAAPRTPSARSMGRPRRCWTSTAIPPSPRRPTAATSTWTSC
jgi:type IV secretion system protein VirD4